ncbi:hypothetical protein HOK31_05815, partial [Candidatus Poribacteria bacterium]|nr:hypothetical protein [Candidatus Poribacteria bacterium]
MRLSIWLAVCFGGIVWAAGAMAAESGLEVAPSDWNIARPESAAEAVADELAVAVDVVVQEADIMAQQIADTINVQAPEVVAQLDLLIDAVDPVAVSVNENIAWTIPGSPVGDGATVVRTSEAALAELPDTLTDMQVLARIVTKSADPENEWGVEGSAQRLYLEGHGLVLLLRVPFPLAPRADVGIAAERETDRLWRETANELWGATPEPAARVAYDAAKVDRLRDRLVEALPYARNVRGLPADGELTVIVAGDAFGRGNAAGLGWYTPMVSQFGGAIAGYSSVRSSSGDDSRLVVSVPLS